VDSKVDLSLNGKLNGKEDSRRLQLKAVLFKIAFETYVQERKARMNGCRELRRDGDITVTAHTDRPETRCA
jgi:hypothetical protein